MYQPVWTEHGDIGCAQRDAASRYEAIAAHLKGMHGFKALDFGAHSGYFSQRLAHDFDAQVLAVDSTPDLAAAASDNITVINRRMGYVELHSMRRFDVVLALSVLHHLPDWKYYLKELYRMWQWGAILFIETANPAERLPKARAHKDSAQIHQLVSELPNAKVLTDTPGFDHAHSRPLWVIDPRECNEPRHRHQRLG